MFVSKLPLIQSHHSQSQKSGKKVDDRITKDMEANCFGPVEIEFISSSSSFRNDSGRSISSSEKGALSSLPGLFFVSVAFSALVAPPDDEGGIRGEADG